jgi:hypothetical protein
VSADQARQGEPTVAEQVATESAKRAAKKAAQKRTTKKAAATPGAAKVRVKMTTSSRGVKAGATRTLPKVDADRLIRQGHAVKA